MWSGEHAPTWLPGRATSASAWTTGCWWLKVSTLTRRPDVCPPSLCLETAMWIWSTVGHGKVFHHMIKILGVDGLFENSRVSLKLCFVCLCPGPQDHGWCSGYTCQRRLSLFHSIVATGHSFDVYFTSISPQKLRLMMLNSNPSEVSPHFQKCCSGCIK